MEMAQQISPPTPGSPTVQVLQNNGLPNANQTPLDLNLSQKTSQNPPKMQDENENAEQNATELSSNPPPTENTTQTTLNVTPPSDMEELKNVSELKTDQQSPTAFQKIIVEPGICGESVVVVNNEAVQNASTMSKDTAVATATPSTGRKRKSPRVKQSPSDPNKKLVLAAGANDEEAPTKSPKQQLQKIKSQATQQPKNKLPDSDTFKNKGPLGPLDIVERRLLLDERKIALAEQRFALEEKKLEATIDIGKGLIMSMERMTSTISSLGVPTTHHR